MTFGLMRTIADVAVAAQCLADPQTERVSCFAQQGYMLLGHDPVRAALNAVVTEVELLLRN